MKQNKIDFIYIKLEYNVITNKSDFFISFMQCNILLIGKYHKIIINRKNR